MNWYIEDRFNNKDKKYIDTVERIATPVMNDFCNRVLYIETYDNISTQFNSCFDETGPFMEFKLNNDGFYIKYNNSIDIKFTEPFKAIIRDLKLKQILKNN